MGHSSQQKTLTPKTIGFNSSSLPLSSLNLLEQELKIVCPTGSNAHVKKGSNDDAWLPLA